VVRGTAQEASARPAALREVQSDMQTIGSELSASSAGQKLRLLAAAEGKRALTGLVFGVVAGVSAPAAESLGVGHWLVWTIGAVALLGLGWASLNAAGWRYHLKRATATDHASRTVRAHRRDYLGSEMARRHAQSLPPLQHGEVREMVQDAVLGTRT